MGQLSATRPVGYVAGCGLRVLVHVMSHHKETALVMLLRSMVDPFGQVDHATDFLMCRRRSESLAMALFVTFVAATLFCRTWSITDVGVSLFSSVVGSAFEVAEVGDSLQSCHERIIAPLAKTMPPRTCDSAWVRLVDPDPVVAKPITRRIVGESHTWAAAMEVLAAAAPPLRATDASLRPSKTNASSDVESPRPVCMVCVCESSASAHAAGAAVVVSFAYGSNTNISQSIDSPWTPSASSGSIVRDGSLRAT